MKIIQFLCYDWRYLQLSVDLKEVMFIYSTQHRSDRSEVRPTSCMPTLSTGSLQGIKWPERVADFQPPSSVGFRMGRSYTCTYPLCLYKYIMGCPLPFAVNSEYSYELSVTEQLPEDKLYEALGLYQTDV